MVNGINTEYGARQKCVNIDDFIKCIENDNYTSFYALIIAKKNGFIIPYQENRHTYGDDHMFYDILWALDKKVKHEAEKSKALEEETVYKQYIEYYSLLFKYLDRDTESPEVCYPTLVYSGLNNYLDQNKALRNDEAYKSVRKQFRKLNDYNQKFKEFVEQHLSKKYSPKAYAKYALYEHNVDLANLDDSIITLLMKLSSKVPTEVLAKVVYEVDSVDLNTRVENKEIDTKLDLTEWFYHTFFSGMGLALIVKDNNITIDDVSFDFIKGKEGFIRKAMQLVGVTDPKDLEGKTIGEIVAIYKQTLTPESLNINPYQGPITFTGNLRQYAILTDNRAVLEVLDTKGVKHDFIDNSGHVYNDIRGYGNTFQTRSYLLEQKTKEGQNEEDTFYHNLLGRHNKVLTKAKVNKIIKGSH